MNIFKVGRWNPILGSIDYGSASEYPFQYLDNFGYAFQENVNLEVIKDVVLVDNYANTTFKYDGKCYTFTPEIGSCHEGKQTLNFA